MLIRSFENFVKSELKSDYMIHDFTGCKVLMGIK